MNKLIIINRVVVPVEAPSRILISPWGQVSSKSGDWIVNEQGVAEIIAALTAHGVDLPIDYDHQTMGGIYASPDGKAPAAGWIKNLEAVPGEGLYANVEWTEEAAKRIAAKEYRYLSPVLLVRGSDMLAVQLHSAGLTNKPAIEGMVPIVNKESVVTEWKFEDVRYWLNLSQSATNEEIVMELEKFSKQLREMLGTAADATAEVVASSLKAKLDELAALKASRVAVCKAVGVTEAAKDDELVLAINTAKAPATSASAVDPTKYAPLVELVVARKELDEVKGQVLSINCEKFIASGKSEGRLCANNEAEWRTRYAANPADAEKAIKLIPDGTFPKDGRVIANSDRQVDGGGTDRIAVINKAKAEFKAEPELEKITSREAFVKDALRIANHAPTLSDDEKKLVVG